MSSRAPFTYDVWKSPEVLSKVSEVAGIELIPALDYEIANINIAVKDDPIDNSVNGTNTNGGPVKPAENDTPAFAWHYDSFPFVCVTMLSDCTGMVGGETAINLPSGEIKKVRGPAMVPPPPHPLLQANKNRATQWSCKAGTSSTKPSRPSVAAKESQW